MSAGNVRVVSFGGKRSPKQTILDILDELDDAELLVVVYLDKDGGINTSWSDGSLLKRLGIMDFVKRRMMDLAIYPGQ